ncbi:MAG: hypothetical protein IKI84_14240 [Clostridia bacterium]|nr:hypothetical protein [Clostridia bacterium]
MKRNISRTVRVDSFLKTPCFILSAALFAGSLAEAFLRWDAMAPPVRIIFRLIGTGKLTAGEIFDAVWPEIAGGALTYPLCVLLGALCGLWGLGTLLFRRTGFAAAAMLLCAALLTALSGGGTALRTFHMARCVLTAAAGCLFALRAVVLSRDARTPADRERSINGFRQNGRKAGRVDERGNVPEERGAADVRTGRLFGAERRPLFKDEEDRPPLFDHGKGQRRRG